MRSTVVAGVRAVLEAREQREVLLDRELVVDGGLLRHPADLRERP